jgi:FkbM family methyltransferase
MRDKEFMANVSEKPDQQLEELLAETTESSRQREADTFNKLAGANVTQIVLFGSGNLGRRTLAGLRKIGIEPLCFVDSNPSKWGQSIDDLSVLSPDEAARAYGKTATFVITVWGALGADRMHSRIERLKQLGCNTVLTFLPLYWKYPDLFLPHYAIGLPHRVHLQAERVRKAFALMADDQSRREFVAQINFRLHGDFSALPAPVSGPMYFRRELFQIGTGDTFVDCGAFDGDTLDSFLQETENSFASIIGFEPDPANFEKLSAKTSRLPAVLSKRIELYQAATGATNQRVRMEIGSGPSSHLGTGEYEVDCLTLDSILRDRPVTIVKMDIEGSELSTLAGAQESIRINSPVLAISAYHRQDDLWNIPMFIHEIHPNYSFYLRPHMLEGWDLVCYSVPPARTVKSSAP